jgi:trehalose 2-sulfotransferase
MSETYAGRAYLLCCDARTGSSLLSETLRATGVAGKPFEYFNRPEIDKPWLRAELGVAASTPFTSFADWRDVILRAGSQPGDIFGAAVHFFQLGHCLETFREPGADPATPPLATLRGFFPRLKLIWLRRRNIVAQAISHHVAIVTDVWNSRHGAATPAGESERGAAYDFDRIDWQVRSVLAANAGWREALAGGEDITLPLAYEELAADLEGAVRRIFAHVGVEPGAAIPPPDLRKQAGAWSAAMEARYREERRRRGGGPVGDEAAI